MASNRDWTRSNRPTDRAAQSTIGSAGAIRALTECVVAATTSSSAQPRHVLVVDDTDSIRDAMLDVLREEGFTALGVVDGEEALAYLNAGGVPPYAVITDLMMPVLDGWELIAALQADERRRGIRIIAMTASPVCSAPRGVPLLRKPFHVNELLGLLEDE